MQVLQLTPEQIASLPVDQQRQVLELVILLLKFINRDLNSWDNS